MSRKIGCLILGTGKSYQKLGAVAANSFSKWHPDIDLHFVNESNQKDYFSFKNKHLFRVGTYKYVMAAELMKVNKYDKIIVLGSDTITCSRLDEFIENNEDDFMATLDYPYPFLSSRINSPNSETHLNADVVCFNNIKPIFDIIKLSKFYKVWVDQGALNEIAWSHWYKYKFSIVDAPYKTSKVVYNVRSKGNMSLPFDYQDHTATNIFASLPKYLAHERPWGEPLSKFYVEDKKLFTGDGKQIKVWHYCDGFSAAGTSTFEKIVNNYIFKWFNEDTKKFFKDCCDAGDFFEKEFVIE